MRDVLAVLLGRKAPKCQAYRQLSESAIIPNEQATGVPAQPSEAPRHEEKRKMLTLDTRSHSTRRAHTINTILRLTY